MRMRTVIALLFFGAVLLIAAFAGFALLFLWSFLDTLLPDAVLVGTVILPTGAAVAGLGALLALLLFLVLYLLAILFHRLVAEPIIGITTAMASFTETGSIKRLPPLSSITELRELTRAFIAYANGVEAVHARDLEISRVKSDFISTAAHQLRTPLTGIRWAMEALQKSPLTDDQKALVDSAVGKSHDLVGIVGTLLDISSIESGKHAYRFEATDLAALAASVVHDLTPLAVERSVALVLTPPAAPLSPAKADRQQISWVLTNLVENAIRYTPAGGSVTISFSESQERLILRVRDTGIGIPEKDRNNIFERFYRADNAIKKENGGNGLGLYIARTIASDHGGDLTFDNNTEGVGTTFTLSLLPMPRAAR